VISILTISNIWLLIAPVQVSHSYIIRLATLQLVTLKLSTTPLYGHTYREPKSINWKHNFEIPMDSVVDYARHWEKREKENIDTLSEWMKSMRLLIQIMI
jgi:hypothetical protein